MADLAITQNELIEELARYAAGDAPENAKTVQELALAANVSDGVVHKRLKILQRLGRLRVHYVVRERIDGRRQSVPAYTILPPPKAAKKSR
jgi:hypothetical protein